MFDEDRSDAKRAWLRRTWRRRRRRRGTTTRRETDDAKRAWRTRQSLCSASSSSAGGGSGSGSGDSSNEEAKAVSWSLPKPKGIIVPAHFVRSGGRSRGGEARERSRRPWPAERGGKREKVSSVRAMAPSGGHRNVSAGRSWQLAVGVAEPGEGGRRRWQFCERSEG